MRRKILHLYQRLTRGFSDEVTWSLDQDLAKWLLPRLRRFKELKIGCPGEFIEAIGDYTNEDHEAGMAKWDAELDEMIWALEYHLGEFEWETFDEDEMVRCQKGLELIGKRWGNLWW